MKKWYRILYGTATFCVFGTLFLLFLLPETVPAHYNLAGEIDRYGSRWEYLLFPGFTLGMTVFFRIIAKAAGGHGDSSGEKGTLITASVTVFFTGFLGFYFMGKAMRHGTDGTDIARCIGIPLGVLLIVIGLILPRTEKNGTFGLRTVWSMRNGSIWKKSQRFCGICAIVCGVCLSVGAFFLRGLPCLLLMLLITAVWANASIAASWYIAKNDRSDGTERQE